MLNLAFRSDPVPKPTLNTPKPWAAMTNPSSKPNLQRITSALTQLHQAQGRTMADQRLGAIADPLPTAPALSMPTLDPHAVRPMPAVGAEPSLDLPFFPTAQKVPARQVTNPRLAMGILKELEKTVAAWERELQQVSLEIQDIHLEGPVINGWLESQPVAHAPNSDGFLQQAEVHQLMDYVNGIPVTGLEQGESLKGSGYRLCSLNADGQVQYQACPAEQVPLVSLAIARHQKLRQLLSRKTDLEARLTHLAEALIAAHSQLVPDAGVG